VSGLRDEIPDIYTESESVALRRLFGAMCRNAVNRIAYGEFWEKNWFGSPGFRTLCGWFECEPEPIAHKCLEQAESLRRRRAAHPDARFQGVY